MEHPLPISAAGRLAGPGDIAPYCAERYGDKIALITPTRDLSYSEIDDLSARAASALAERGVQPGDVVSLLGPNSWQWVVGYHAILRLGAVVNPLNFMLTRRRSLTRCPTADQLVC